MDSLWSIFGLPWKYGDYHRTTFYLSQRMKNVIGQDRAASLLREYSMKANHLKKVPERSRVYVPLEQSQTQSAVFPPSSVDQGQTPAAFHKYGEGWVGFIGDVNNEQGSQALLMAMLAAKTLLCLLEIHQCVWEASKESLQDQILAACSEKDASRMNTLLDQWRELLSSQAAKSGSVGILQQLLDGYNTTAALN
ncbi:MAG: hypothetical protein Q9184_007687 [Pyrenodesmia sp. 2 TL-2023]